MADLVGAGVEKTGCSGRSYLLAARPDLAFEIVYHPSFDPGLVPGAALFVIFRENFDFKRFLSLPSWPRKTI
ncbi:hypothetical protein [Thalassospira povalilytica]|uniref:Uncharacterized protein n=1 Tax=Thalassospira povalilytica TaxID=732237 RepID=A0ABX4RAF7_9PROT|nr:hypothetical protein [Thalassospira povalilytica]PKR50129.1 hypothetical protein CU041_10520 [Thalassospira povalilytica]